MSKILTGESSLWGLHTGQADWARYVWTYAAVFIPKSEYQKYHACQVYRLTERKPWSTKHQQVSQSSVKDRLIAF
jgi:hypothetical protein